MPTIQRRTIRGDRWVDSRIDEGRDGDNGDGDNDSGDYDDDKTFLVQKEEIRKENTQTNTANIMKTKG